MPVPIEKQVMIIFVANQGLLDDIAIEHLARFEREFLEFVDSDYPDVVRELATEFKIDEKTEADLKRAGEQFKTRFVESLASSS